MVAHLPLSHRFLRPFILFFSRFSFWCSNWVFSVVLSSNSLILSSVTFILISNLFIEFFLLIIVFSSYIIAIWFFLFLSSISFVRFFCFFLLLLHLLQVYFKLLTEAFMRQWL